MRSRLFFLVAIVFAAAGQPQQTTPVVPSASVDPAEGGPVLGLTDLGLHLRFGAIDDAPSVEVVDAGSTAESGGLQPGDLLAAIEGQPVTSPVSVVRLLSEQSGRVANVEVWRGEEPVEATLPVRMSSESWSQARADAEKAASLLTRERIRLLDQAIAAYRAANGSYPDVSAFQRLRDALVPAHLDALPLFDGSGDPLFYVLSPDRTEYRVVSGSQPVDRSSAVEPATRVSVQSRLSPEEVKAASERGRALYFGKEGIAKDDVAAFPFLIRAAEGGDVFAMQIVAGYYQFGRGHIDKDHVEALRWLRSAVAVEPEGAYEWCRIGDILFDGEARVRAEQEAMEAYETCFAHAEDESRRGFAAFALGRVYERWKQTDRAIEWFEKSARLKPEWDLPRRKAEDLRGRR